MREPISPEVVEQAKYVNSALGYRVTYPAELSLRVYTPEYVALGEEAGEGFDADVSLTYVNQGEDDTWGSFDAFVEARVVAQCAADGPDRSIYCTDFVEREPFTSDSGEGGWRVLLNQETVVPGDGALLEKRTRGPFYIFPFSEESGSYAALVIHPPIAGDDADVADVVAMVARSFQRVEEVADEEHIERFGFIRGVDLTGERVKLAFDEARMLSGNEAQDAAIRAGVCNEATREECTPNDFFIENIDDTVVLIPTAETVEVRMVTYPEGSSTPLAEHAIDIAEFVALISDIDQQWRIPPYTLVLNTEGEVVKIEEVYVP